MLTYEKYIADTGVSAFASMIAALAIWRFGNFDGGSVPCLMVAARMLCIMMLCACCGRYPGEWAPEYKEIAPRVLDTVSAIGVAWLFVSVLVEVDRMPGAKAAACGMLVCLALASCGIHRLHAVVLTWILVAYYVIGVLSVQ